MEYISCACVYITLRISALSSLVHVLSFVLRTPENKDMCSEAREERIGMPNTDELWTGKNDVLG